jgi:hypothetical protein
MLSSLLHVIVYVTHNLLNVLVQIANKMGLKKCILAQKVCFIFRSTFVRNVSLYDEYCSRNLAAGKMSCLPVERPTNRDQFLPRGKRPDRL